MFALALILLADAAPVSVTPVTIDPARMTREQIAAHNQSLTRRDPDYIRCVRYAAPGSLIDNKQTCRTNRAWAEATGAVMTMPAMQRTGCAGSSRHVSSLTSRTLRGSSSQAGASWPAG